MIRLFILALALIAGGIAGWLALGMIGDDADVVIDAPPPVPMGEVLVAAQPLARGATLTVETVSWRAWPEDAITGAFIARAEAPDAVEKYEGWVLRAALLAGEPLRLDRMADTASGLMSLILSPGMRAIALRVAADTSAGGFVLPNDRVDLIHTVQRDVDRDGAEEPVSLTIVENVRVLAVDQLADEGAIEGAKLGDTITVELSPQQVEIVEMARNAGRITLSLRAVSDFGETEIGNIALVTPGFPLWVAETDSILASQLRDQPSPEREAAGSPAVAAADSAGPEIDMLAMLGISPDGQRRKEKVEPDATETPAPVRVEPSPVRPEAADAAPPPVAASFALREPARPHTIRIIGSGSVRYVEVVPAEQFPTETPVMTEERQSGRPDGPVNVGVS